MATKQLADICGITAQLCSSSKTCKVIAKDLQQARKMWGETETILQNKQDRCLTEPEWSYRTSKKDVWENKSTPLSQK